MIVRYVVRVADKELLVPFDANRTVADLAGEIDRRCQRLLVASITGRRVAGLRLGELSAAKLKGSQLLRDVLTAQDVVHVELAGSDTPAPAAVGEPWRASRPASASRGRPAMQPSPYAVVRPQSATRARASRPGTADRLAGRGAALRASQTAEAERAKPAEAEGAPPAAPLSPAGVQRKAEADFAVAREQSLARYPSAAWVGPSAAPAVRVSRREQFLHTLLRDANAITTGAGVSSKSAPQQVPEWKQRLLERAKLTALAPGRAPPKLFKVANPSERPRAASASGQRPGAQAGSPPKSAVASMGTLLQSRVGAGEFAASSAAYLAQAVRELELSSGRANEAAPGGAELAQPRDVALQAARPRAGSARRRPRSAAPLASRGAHETAAAERQLYHYADLLAQQELEAYYLRDKEEKLRAQIQARLSAEAAAIDSRFAHIEDSGDNLFQAAVQMRKRLFERRSLCEVRINETQAANAQLREAVGLLRKQRAGLLARTRRADARTASLALDSKHVVHVAHSTVDDGAKLESKLERTQTEFAWETEAHEKALAAMDGAAAELEGALVRRIEEVDEAAEKERQRAWARAHEHRERAVSMVTRYGKLQESRAYLQAELANICELLGVQHDEGLKPSTPLEVVSSYRAREALNTSLWRTGDEHTQAREALLAEVRSLEELAARLEAAPVAQPAEAEAEAAPAEEPAGPSLADLEASAQALEPRLDRLVEPVGKIFDLLDLYESEQLPAVAGINGLTRETLCDHMHTVDVGVRELQLRAQALVGKRGDEVGEILRLFAQSLHLPQAAPVDTAALRASVLQQVGRMELMITGYDHA